MSENKIATKADLQRMYNKMLPYLGGMPEMVVNKFSKGDLYSTDEKMIGQWIDGKPLYQRTITDTTPSNNVQVEYQTGWTNIETMFMVNGYVNNSYDNNTAINSSQSSSSYIYCNVGNNGTRYYIGCNGDWLYNRPFVITFNYTKTTDSPISIGSDTDYSTEEKIVGTWIDGKPIYQRTYQQNLELTPNTWVNTSMSDTGISKVINAVAYNANASIDCLLCGPNNGYIAINLVRNSALSIVAFTIQYTKTTD